MNRITAMSVPLLLVGGYCVALLFPDHALRLRAALGAGADTLIHPPDVEPISPRAEDAIALLSAEERSRMELVELKRDRDLLVEDLAYQVAINDALKEKLRIAEASRDALKDLAEQLISFGLSRPVLMLKPSPSVEPGAGEETPAGSAPAPQAFGKVGS